VHGGGCYLVDRLTLGVDTLDRGAHISYGNAKGTEAYALDSRSCFELVREGEERGLFVLDVVPQVVE